MTSKRLIYQISLDTPDDVLLSMGIDLTHPAWTVLCVQTDHSGKPAPEPGYRLNEYKGGPDHSHSRLGPWKVESEGQCYPANMPGMQNFDEVWMYECVYDPLPESDNPWIETHKLDPATYPDWLKEEMGMTASV